MNIRIYQTPSVTSYAFMNYEFATQHGFSFKDYNKVADFDYASDGKDDDSILNQIWNIGNDGTLQKFSRMRSVSVSDIIELDGRYYYVDSFGFKRI